MPRPKVRRLRQRLVLALCGVLLALVGTVITAQPAAAECTPGNVPQLAGSGLPGLIDDKTSAEDPTTKYGQYGWAGLRWTTCDLDRSAMGIPREDTLDVKIDTFLGNLGLGLAVTLAATMTQLHQWAVYPGSLLAPIDGLLTDITNAVKDSTWTPWVAAFIIAAAVGVCMIAFRGEVRRAWRTVAAVGLACLAIAWISTPVVSTRLANDSGSSPSGPLQFETVRMSGAEHAATVFDGAAASIVSSVDTNIAKTKPKDEGDRPANDDEARGAILQDKLLWSLWARGELGGQAAGAKYGEDLYKAAAVKWSDSASVDSDKRRKEFSKVAERIQKDDPATYDQLRGASLGRSGYGLLAAVIMGCIALIRIPAELMMIAGLLVMRILVMFAPVLALAAILESTRPVAKAGLKIAIASVVNVAIYGVIASIHAALTGLVVTKAQNLALATAGIVVVTIVVWLISKPFRSVTRPATGQQAADAMTSAGDNASSMPGRWFGGITSGLGALAGSYLGSKPRGGSPGAAPESPHQDQPESIRSNPLPYPLPWPNMPPPKPPAPSPPAPPNPPAPPGGSYPVLVPEVEGGPDAAPELSGRPASPSLPPSGSGAAELPAAESRVTIAIEAPGSGSPVPIGVSPAGGGAGRYEYELEPELFRPDQVVIPGEVVSVRDDLVVSHAPATLAEPERGPDGRLTAEVFRPDSELVGAR